MRTYEIAGIVLRRFGEMLLSCSAISALVALGRRNPHLRDTLEVEATVLLIGLAVFLLANAILMRRCRFIIGRNRKLYTTTNLLAWAMFAALHQLVLTCSGEEGAIYNYAYHLAGIGELSGMNTRGSALLFDAIILLLIFVSQIGMRRILQEAERELNARYD